MLRGGSIISAVLVSGHVCPSRIALPLSLARVRHARTFLYYKFEVLRNLYEALQVSYLREWYW